MPPNLPLPKNPPKATWSDLRYVVQLSRSTRRFDDATLLAQFQEYPAIYKAAVALNLWKPWEIPTLEGVDAIAEMLRKHASIDPQNAELSFVATFLQEQADPQADRTALPGSPSPTTREGKRGGEGSRSEGGDAASGGQCEGTAQWKRKGGRRPLEKSKPLKFQVYQRIQQAHRPGENYVDTVRRLKGDKDFMEQIKEAGEKVDTKLVRKALAFFDQRRRDRARKQQETDPA